MSRIQPIAEELAKNLDEQVRIWRVLLELSRKQLEALKAQDAETVHDVLQQIEVTMLERSRAEVRRSMLVEKIAAILEIPSADVTKEIITSECDATLATRINLSAKNLKLLVDDLESVVARNAAMLEQELSIIEIMVRGATEDQSSRTTYAKSGTQADAPRLRLLDAQV